MSYLGSWNIDKYLTFECNTHNPETGAAADADAEPAYRIYEDETETAILTGTLAKLDDANTTGFYSERVQLTAASGFEVDKSYRVYISATVAGVTASKSDTFQVVSDLATDTEIADAVRDHVVETAGSITFGQALAYLLSACAGVTADSGLTFKTPNGTTVRISATVAASERTSITLTPPSY